MRKLWECAKAVVAVVLWAAVMEVLHHYNFFPEKWLADHATDLLDITPMTVQQPVIQWSIIILLAALTLFAEHWVPAFVPSIRKRFSKSSNSYLSHRDSEMTHAIEGMAFRSAWGKWYPSQFLAKDKNYLVQDKHNQDQLMMIATSVVTDAAVNGKLEIKGRPRNSRKYETIPKEDWRLIFLHPEPDIRTIWKVSIRPRADVSTERVAELLEYDSLIVDSENFEKLWPRSEAAIDAARLKNLQAAKKNGAPQSEVDKLM